MPKRSRIDRYRRFFEESPEPMWLFDEETLRFVEVNRAASTVYGYSKDEFLRMTILDIRPREDAPLLLAHIKDGGGLRGEWVHCTKAGARMYVEVAATRMTLDGRPLRLVIARDVSLKVALEAQLRHSQKIETVGQLAGGIAHDFNNLLTAIVGHVEVLSDFLAAGDPRTAEVSAIRDAAFAAADLTRRLLAFSSRQQMRPGVVNLNDALDRVKRVMQRVLPSTISLDTRPAERLWSVRADPGQIDQIVLNLAVNARDAMPHGGTLTLETANVTVNPDAARRRSVQQGDYVELSVSDTGEGIPQDVRVRLFEPFFSTRDRRVGKGLGLATVYGIVKQSGGHILVESEVGCGAKFAVYLPVASAPEAAGPTRTLPEPDRETILILEEDRAVRSLIADVLRRRGYRLLVAEDGPDALRIAKEGPEPIDLFVASTTDGTEDGANVTPSVAAARPAMRVLILQKPFTPESLARKVRSVIDGRGGGEGGEGRVR